MSTHRKVYFRTTASAAILCAAALSAPAAAQDSPAGDQLAATDQEVIVVTGSRIVQPNLEASAPLTVLSQDEVKLQGTTRIEDLLNSLPSVVGSQSSGQANGADGTATVDLRGLGSTRTLVLINGRRLLPGDPSPSSGSAADINMIPTALLKRVEVLTGGASSTYGADAVSGVVNFIIDTDFEGFRIDGQYGVYVHDNDNKVLPSLLNAQQEAGLTGYDYPRDVTWDGDILDTTVAFGTNFGDGRGRATAYFGYRKVLAVTQNNRDYSACVLQNDGQDPFCGGSATSANGNALVFNPSVDPSGSVFYTFAPGGGFVNDVSIYNFGPNNYYQRPDERYTAGAFVDYEVSDAFKPYLEFMFMDDKTVAQIAPSGNFGNTYTVNCDNPLLSAEQSAVICASDNLINGFIGNFPLAVAAPFNPDPGAAPIAFTDSRGVQYNQGFFQLLRRNVEGGPRRSELTHTNYRAVLGSKGDLGEAWSYDAYYQYGRSNYTQIYSNEFSVARLNRALNVVTDTRTGSATFGQPVCRSVIDGSDPNCVPYNVFAGEGGASPASVQYLSATGFQSGHTSEQVANASLTGQLGQYGITAPWAQDGVAINVGFEWRRESLDLQTDSAFSSGDLTGQGGATLPLSGSFRVYELFGETLIPIVQDGFFYDLSLNAGYRRSWYKTSADREYDTDTYKIGFDFAPIRDIRFRGTYNRAVRAPNIQELFRTPAVGLAGSTDPCADGTISPTDYGCIAQGLAPGFTVTANPAEQYNALLGGNPDLQPEKATTKTIGVVVQPRAVPRFALTVDYYDIKVENAINSFGPDAILADCVANATADFTPASCNLVNRDAAGSLWLTPDGFVRDLPGNVGSIQTKGIEVGASYSLPVGTFGQLSLGFNGTYVDEYRVDNGLTAPYDCAGLYGATCSAGGTTQSGGPLPRWRHKAQVSLTTPQDFRVWLQWRYVGPVTAETTTSNSTLAGSTPLELSRRLSAQSYFDLAFTYTFKDSYTFRLGANNILDREPPLVSSSGGLCPTGPCNGNTFPATYDALGRYVFAGFTLDF